MTTDPPGSQLVKLEATCSQCGFRYPSGLETVVGGPNVQVLSFEMKMTGSSPSCPRCRGTASINSKFAVLESGIIDLSSSALTLEEIAKIVELLREESRQRDVNVERAADQIARLNPKAAGFAQWLRNNATTANVIPILVGALQILAGWYFARMTQNAPPAAPAMSVGSTSQHQQPCFSPTPEEIRQAFRQLAAEEAERERKRRLQVDRNKRKRERKEQRYVDREKKKPRQ